MSIYLTTMPDGKPALVMPGEDARNESVIVTFGPEDRAAINELIDLMRPVNPTVRLRGTKHLTRQS